MEKKKAQICQILKNNFTNRQIFIISSSEYPNF
jgi:hypothetical protein